MTTTTATRPGATIDELSAAIIDAAVEIVDELGVEGLANRRLAERAGTTTMSIYSRFGSKDGVAHALFDHGFELLGARLDAHPPNGSAHDALVEFCAAYRTFALERPGLYSIMFERALTLESGFTSGPATRAFNALARHVAAVTDSELDDANTRSNTFGLWALCHGLVHLELTGTGSTHRTDTSAELFRRATSVHASGIAATTADAR